MADPGGGGGGFRPPITPVVVFYHLFGSEILSVENQIVSQKQDASRGVVRTGTHALAS